MDGIWDFLELLDLQPLEADPIIQLLVEHMGDKLTASSGKKGDIALCFKPRRSVDANILWLKLNCR